MTNAFKVGSGGRGKGKGKWGGGEGKGEVGGRRSGVKGKWGEGEVGERGKGKGERGKGKGERGKGDGKNIFLEEFSFGLKERKYQEQNTYQPLRLSCFQMV